MAAEAAAEVGAADLLAAAALPRALAATKAAADRLVTAVGIGEDTAEVTEVGTEAATEAASGEAIVVGSEEASGAGVVAEGKSVLCELIQCD